MNRAKLSNLYYGKGVLIGKSNEDYDEFRELRRGRERAIKLMKIVESSLTEEQAMKKIFLND